MIGVGDKLSVSFNWSSVGAKKRETHKSEAVTGHLEPIQGNRIVVHTSNAGLVIRFGCWRRNGADGKDSGILVDLENDIL